MMNCKKLIRMNKKKNRYDKRKIKLYNTVSELYDKRFDNYYDEYNKLSDVKNNYNKKFKPILKIMIMTDGLQKKI